MLTFAGAVNALLMCVAACGRDAESTAGIVVAILVVVVVVVNREMRCEQKAARLLCHETCTKKYTMLQLFVESQY